MSVLTDLPSLIDPFMEDPPSDHVVDMASFPHGRVWTPFLILDELSIIRASAKVQEALGHCTHEYVLMVDHFHADVRPSIHADAQCDYYVGKRSGIVFASANDALMFRLAFS